MNIHQQLLNLRQQEKQITSQIIDKLQIMEDHRGYLKLGYSSLFDYLVRGLSYSESTAYQRQSCLRLSREIPEIKEKIDQGQLTYSTITMAYKVVKNKPLEQKREILQQLENKSSREVKKLLAEPVKPVQIKQSIYQEKVVLRLELSREQFAKFEQLKALKSHAHDSANLVISLIENELKKYQAVDFKKSKSQNPRFVSRRLRNSLLSNAKYKCQYPGCEETHYLQIDHKTPVRRGGQAEPENLQVLCSAHNRLKG